MQSYRYFHNQGRARFQPGYKPPPQGNVGVDISEDIKVVVNVTIDAVLKLGAQDLAGRYIAPSAGIILNRANFWIGFTGIEPFPPSAGGPEDMNLLEPMQIPEPPPKIDCE